MSSCDLYAIAGRPPDIATVDWQWAESWLAEAVGARIRVCGARDDVPPGGRLLTRVDTSALLPRACGRLRRNCRIEGAAPFTADLDSAVAAIGDEIDQRWPELKRVPPIPEPYTCAIVLTHDVDNIDRWTSQHVAHLARHVPERLGMEGARAVWRLPIAALRRLWEHPDIARRVRACVNLEREFDARGTFLFFSPEARHRRALDGWYTPNTRFGKGVLGAFWRELQDDGFDVGLHLSIGAHADARTIAEEWSGMITAVPGAASCRNHYLKESPGVTFEALSASGVQVDLTLVSTGFAYGTGLPFRPDAGSAYRLPTVFDDQEIPVDGATADLLDRIWATWESVLTEAHRNRSAATVLLHPGKADSPAMLERLLRWGASHGAWMCSAADFIAVWDRRATGVRLAGPPSPQTERRIHAGLA